MKGASTPAKEGTDYALIHGSLMLLAFGFLAPAGTFVARYLKALGILIIDLLFQYNLMIKFQDMLGT